MTDFDQPSSLPPLRARTVTGRAKAILLTPTTEWPLIDAEPETIGAIFRGYVVPLAAIGPIAGLIGSQLFGWGLFGISYRPSLIASLVQAIVGFGMALLGTYVLAMIIEALAPTFGGIKDRTKAYKVAAYSATAGWVAGIFGLIPSLAFLSILGLYSLYLLWLGLPMLMRVATDKAVAYFVSVLVAGAVIFFVIGAVTTAIASAVATPFVAATVTTDSGTVTVPGVGTLDMAKLDAATKQMEAATARAQSGAATPGTAPDALQAMLPAVLPGGFARTGLESASAGGAGIGGSTATGTYKSGEQEVRLTVTDMGAAGAIAALGAAFNVNTTKDDADEYEKTSTVGGRMTTEKWHKGNSSGEYSTVAGSRFLVQAEGNPASLDGLKAAVSAVDIAKLEAMAKG